MACVNCAWGYRWIAGELLELGHRFAPSAVWRVLKDSGIDPASRRSGPSWKQFLTVQARAVIATDFLHVDTVLLKGLCVLVFIEHGTRRMHVAGITAHPDGPWTVQQACNLAMALGERLEAMRLLIRDHGGIFAVGFDAVFEGCGLTVLCSPPQAPRANAICERLIGTLRRELVDRVLILDAARLRAVLEEYATHYNTARPHQGIDQRVPDDDSDVSEARVIDLDTARIRRRPVLGGITSEYHVAT
jgi:putative transposase